MVQGARLLGITYDRHTNEFELDSGDHRLLEPKEVWTIEEEDGFLSAVEVVHSDGTREVVSIKRVGLRRWAEGSPLGTQDPRLDGKPHVVGAMV